MARQNSPLSGGGSPLAARYCGGYHDLSGGKLKVFKKKQMRGGKKTAAF